MVQRLFSLFPAEAAGYGLDPAGMLLRNLKSAAHPSWEIAALFIVVALLSFGVLTPPSCIASSVVQTAILFGSDHRSQTFRYRRGNFRLAFALALLDKSRQVFELAKLR